MTGRILVADSDAAHNKAMAGLVRSHSAVCETVVDGNEALSKLLDSEPGHYDMVFIDVNLPGQDGIAVTRKFRESKRPDADSLPIVGMTGVPDSSRFDEVHDAGLNILANKPISMSVMFSLITLLVREKGISAVFCNEANLRARRLKAERDRAIEVERSRSYFFSTVSHDIRTPLNAIIGFSQMLSLGFENPAEQKKAIDSIIVSGKTLLQLVNDILDLSKLEAGKMTIDPEPSDCEHIVNEIVESFKAANPNSSVEIRGKVSYMPMLMVDPQRIRQILFNLVGNAVKFTETGYVEIRSTFAVTGKEVGTLRFEVEDTGCGISLENMQRIAAPYMQFNKGAKKNGTGLGLAICRQLVNAMKGNLSLKSAVGRGSTFEIEIPNVQVGSSVLREKLSATQRIQVVSSRVNTAAVSKVLVVDDSNINLMVLKAMLTRLGVPKIVTASNGKEAIDLLMKSYGAGDDVFDMVLTDMWMPGMDGEAMIKVIRAQPHFRRLPVYAITADVEARKTTASLGFTGVLLKPVTVEELRAILEEK